MKKREMNDKSIQINPWIVWILGSVFYAYQYIIRVLPNIMMPVFMDEFHIDAASFGQFNGLYYLGYVAMHIPLGLALDRFGPRIVMTLSALFMVLGLTPLLYADLWIYPCIGRVLLGMGSAGATLGLFKIIRTVFPEAYFARMLSLSIAIGLLGAIYGGQPLNHWIEAYGWEAIVKGTAYAGVALAFCIYGIVPKHKATRLREDCIVNAIKAILVNRKFIMVCLFSGLLIGPLEGFADGWGVQFLKTVYLVKDEFATNITSLIFLGMCFGGPLLSYLSSKRKRYFEWIIVAAVTMAMCFVLLLTGVIPGSIIGVIFFLIGIMCGYQILSVYKACTYVSESRIGLATAIANMIVMSYGYFFHSSIGRIMIAVWDGQVVNGTPIYGTHAFVCALAVIPIALVIGAMGFLILKWRSSDSVS